MGSRWRLEDVVLVFHDHTKGRMPRCTFRRYIFRYLVTLGTQSRRLPMNSSRNNSYAAERLSNNQHRGIFSAFSSKNEKVKIESDGIAYRPQEALSRGEIWMRLQP
jgi:hypothetical protein